MLVIVELRGTGNWILTRLILFPQLGGHYGHDDKRMVSAYFLDKSYVDKVGTNGLKFRWDQPADTDYHNVRLVGVIHFSTGAAGPDAHTVHGGAIATVLDNNCGFILNGLFFTGSRTANLNINYRDRVPTGSPVAFRCKVDRMEGRKTWVSTALLDPQSVIERGFWGGKEDGPKVLAEATALMIHGSKHLDTSKVKSK